MHQICPFLQPVLVISLASFSLVNFTGTKVCVGVGGLGGGGGVHQPRIYERNHLTAENPDIICTRRPLRC